MMTSKYIPLMQHLSASGHGLVRMRFSEIEQVLGFVLPESAYKYPAWWANNAHHHALSWTDAGYNTEQLDLKNQTVYFRKTT